MYVFGLVPEKMWSDEKYSNHMGNANKNINGIGYCGDFLNEFKWKWKFVTNKLLTEL
jgi:hypothetical protein